MGRLIARVAVGLLFAGHGVQKVFGWFGGPGPEGAGQMMDSIGLRPGRRNAMLSGAVETAGGAMLAAGFLTPVAGAALTGNMVTAIETVHRSSGFWNQNGGYEFPLTLIAAVAAIVDGGPGPLSLDEALGIDASGSTWALLSLATGVAGSALVIEAGKRTAGAQQTSPGAAPEPAADVPAAAHA